MRRAETWTQTPGSGFSLEVMKYCAQSLTYLVDLLFYKMKGWTKNSLLVFPDVNSISITSQFRWMPLCKIKTSAEGIDSKMDMCSSGA